MNAATHALIPAAVPGGRGEAGDGGAGAPRSASPMADFVMDALADVIAEKVAAKVLAGTASGDRWPLIMTAKDATEYLGLRSVNQLRSLVNDGKLPLMRGGSEWLLSKAEIDKARGAA